MPIEIDPKSCVVSKRMSRLIQRLNGAAAERKMWYDGPAEYKYEEIMQNGSPELQEAVFIVTGGVAPGNKGDSHVKVS